MDTNYDLQSVSEELTVDMEATHTNEEANQRYCKTMQATNAVLDARPIRTTPTVTVQAATKLLARIVEDLKPSEKLASTMLLEAFRAWAEQYNNFMRQNKRAFEDLGLETARAYLTKVIGHKLSQRTNYFKEVQGPSESFQD